MKRRELQDVTKPENNPGKDWRHGGFVGKLPADHGAALDCGGASQFGTKKKSKRVGTDVDTCVVGNVRKPDDPGMTIMEDAASSDDPCKAYSYFNTLSQPNFRASRSPPTLDRS